MGVPLEAPAAVHQHWASVPNCSDINFLFKSPFLGIVKRVKCQGWGQLAYDGAATRQAMYHIRNKKPRWDWEYIGWEEVGGERGGSAPKDFKEKYAEYWKNW